MRAFIVCGGATVVMDPCPTWHAQRLEAERMHASAREAGTPSTVRVDHEDLPVHPRERMMLLSIDGQWDTIPPAIPPEGM